MKQLELRKNGKGQTLYPVCRWATNQHILYGMHDKLMNRIYEGDEKVSYADAAELERLMGVFDGNVYQGMVYATWQDYKAIKNLIGGYAARH